MTAKILKQEMWIIRVDWPWDDPLPSDIVKKIHVWFLELEQLSNVRIPRSLQQRFHKSQLTHICRCISKDIWSSDL